MCAQTWSYGHETFCLCILEVRTTCRAPKLVTLASIFTFWELPLKTSDCSRKGNIQAHRAHMSPRATSFDVWQALSSPKMCDRHWVLPRTLSSVSRSYGQARAYTVVRNERGGCRCEPGFEKFLSILLSRCTFSALRKKVFIPFSRVHFTSKNVFFAKGFDIHFWLHFE